MLSREAVKHEIANCFENTLFGISQELANIELSYILINFIFLRWTFKLLVYCVYIDLRFDFKIFDLYITSLA